MEGSDWDDEGAVGNTPQPEPAPVPAAPPAPVAPKPPLAPKVPPKKDVSKGIAAKGGRSRTPRRVAPRRRRTIRGGVEPGEQAPAPAAAPESPLPDESLAAPPAPAPVAPPPAPAPRPMTPEEAHAFSVAQIDSIDLAPALHIINPESKFVVVTYWWGRTKMNANTQWPCPDVYVDSVLEEIEEAELDPANEDYNPELATFMTEYAKQKAFVLSPAFKALQGDELRRKQIEWHRTKLKFQGFQKARRARNIAKIKNEILPNKVFKKPKAQGYNPTHVPGYPTLAEIANGPVEAEYPAVDSGVEKGGLYREPIAIPAMIAEWEQACIKAKCNYLVQEYDGFADPVVSRYQSAINAKPLFIKKALETCQGRSVLYIDGDMFIHKYPAIFDMENVDFMAQGWDFDPRTNKRFAIHQCFDPYIFETSGGTMYYGNTQTARKLLDDWAAASAEPQNYGKADDRVLSMIFTQYNMVLPVNIIQLPIEYLWLTDKFANFKWKVDPAENKEFTDFVEAIERERDAAKAANDTVKEADRIAVLADLQSMTTTPAARIADTIIEHPGCLTAEEAAADQGAAEDRQPPGYINEITNRTKCDLATGAFYEYVFFPTKAMVETMRPYLNYMKRAVNFKNLGRMVDVVEYDTRFGTEPDARAMTTTVVKNLANAYAAMLGGLSQSIAAAQTDAAGHKYVVLPVDTSIGDIVCYLYGGVSVHIGAQFEPAPGPEIEACATNRGGRFLDRYLPEVKLDVKQPMFFSSGSRILFHLLLLCEKLTDINTHLMGSYMFISRIRWFLIQKGKNAADEPGGKPRVLKKLVNPEAEAMKQILDEAKKAPEPAAEVGAIPKKVHQIWFGGEIPEWRKYLFDLNKAAAEKNGYVYRLWQNADRTADNFKSTIGYQNGAIEAGTKSGQSRWAQVADLARLEIIYQNGGIYIDSLFETGDDFYKAITEKSNAGVAFIGCNEDPCEPKLDCIGAGGKKYLSNSFFAAMQWSPVMERLLKDERLGAIDLEDPALNQTTGPYYLREGIVDPVADKVFLFETGQIYPFPMSGSALRPAEPNPFLLRAPSENSIQVKDGMWLQKGALQLLRAQGRPVMPLALYHVGLGGTWSL